MQADVGTFHPKNHKRLNKRSESERNGEIERVLDKVKKIESESVLQTVELPCFLYKVQEYVYTYK